MPSLFDPIRLGAIEAPNRIVMAPLTRARATREAVPVPIMAEYYAQRASAGLLVTEATGISRAGLGWPWAPGIWNDEQIAGWRVVTDAVHAAGGRIVTQLWHMGRLVHPSVSGQPAVSPSAIAAPGPTRTYEGKQDYVEPVALDQAGIDAIVADYAKAARNAIAAGFDGIQLHGANGYLIDQFLRDGTNQRTDGYGGSIANRIRFLGEVTRAVGAEIGLGRTGVRLSPNGGSQGCDDSNREPLFVAAAALLAEIGIAFLEIREPLLENSGFRDPGRPLVGAAMRKVYPGPLIFNGDYDGALAQAQLDNGIADAISFGRPLIANPDLPERIAAGLPLAIPNPKTFYSPGPEGYIDYPRAR